MKSAWKGIAVLAVLLGVALVVVIPQLSKNGPSQRPSLPAASPGETSTPALPSSNSETTPSPGGSSLNPAGSAEAVNARITALELLLRDNSTDLKALTELGGLYFQLKVYPRAADTFAAALELDPNNARLRTDLGSSLLYQGMLGLAKREYLASIAANPALPDPHFNLAVILSHSSSPDIPGALAEWREVIRLAPDSDLARSAEQYINSYQSPTALGTPETSQ
ncbi:MAG: tetratricopeptide repeat protein [Chloroflexi bacterium]|nr:tetratricopeptide repeat protein [Chloroflexota bacterium]